jgi:Transcriptional activator of glycolytic enzymes
MTEPFINEHIMELQRTKWAQLIGAHQESRLLKHSWEWRTEDWLPHYIYPELASITAIWEEWANSLNGYLSTRELEERWGAKWRRNLPGLKTAHSR